MSSCLEGAWKTIYLEVWRVNGDELSLLPAPEQTKFYRGDCYVVQFTYPGNERYENLFYAWIGCSSVMEDRRDDISHMNAIVDSTKGDPVLVLNFFPKLVDNETGGCSSAEAKNKMGDINECARENPKAPSDEGVCKLCGVNKDDKKVLLCDMCDSGYHTYCLNPPLAKIPHGNWYCPSCVTGNCFSQGPSQSSEVISRFRKKRCQREFNHRFPKALAHLVTTMAMKEYWEYTVEERILLLKFLCDEVLNSAKIREHLEQCASMSADLQ